MQIDITPKALDWIRRKQLFYRSKSRYPRILLAAQTCHGAEFRIFFDYSLEDDLHVQLPELEILVSEALLKKYGGFEIDLEHFFFTTRLLVKPINDIRQCDCGKSIPCGDRI